MAIVPLNVHRQQGGIRYTRANFLFWRRIVRKGAVVMRFLDNVRAATALCLSVLLAGLPAGGAQAPRALNIVIVEGDGAINNLRQRVAREPIVQVEDENRRPVAGAIVIFTLPQNGASGVFADGSRTFSTITGPDGRAAARGITTNNLKGEMQIRVNASYQGQTASATISQSNASVAAAVSAKTWTLIGIIGAAAAVGVTLAVTQGGNGSTTPGTPARPPVQIGVGTPVVTPPR